MKMNEFAGVKYEKNNKDYSEENQKYEDYIEGKKMKMNISINI